MNKVTKAGWWRLAAALAATAPALLARGLRLDLTPVTTVMVFGAGVVASAFPTFAIAGWQQLGPSANTTWYQA